ncbi:MAG: GntR family transcriptional regulator [Spirochaetes bacterium]|nr:GntR family transcriptional regulator [Spirochaetota bacterium]
MALTIYEQVVEDIQQKINKGILKPGDMIPSENELSKKYNTSRMTIHKGLTQLAGKGYIYSVQGKGNFVCAPDSKYFLHFSEKELIDEYLDRMKLLEVNIIKPADEIRKHLKASKNDKVIIIRRIFSSEKGPFAYDTKYLPYKKAKPIVEQIIDYATFPEIVANMETLFSVKNEIILSTKAADMEEVEHLKVKKGYPLMVIEQKYLNYKDEPIGWGLLLIKNEFCKLHAVSSFK